MWAALGGGIAGFLLKLLFFRGEKLQGAKTVKKETDAAAAAIRKETVSNAEAAHAATAEITEKAESEIKAASMSELAGLVNSAFPGGEDE